MAGFQPFFYNRMMNITFQFINEGIGYLNDFECGFLSFIHHNNPAVKINLFKRLLYDLPVSKSGRGH
ncbi:Uncharacterised protein [Mycobacterium tuberculosis]|nr:Uncharacterised protein [Mycobacterium tuberculosis]